MAEQLVRGVSGVITDIPQIQADLAVYTQGSQKNFYEAGILSAKIYQYFTDQHVNNW